LTPRKASRILTQHDSTDTSDHLSGARAVDQRGRLRQKGARSRATPTAATTSRSGTTATTAPTATTATPGATYSELSGKKG
jgi:hypothetical protein